MDENQYIMCPICGSKEIEAAGYVTLKLFSDNGSIMVGDISKAGWNADSEASCNYCNWQGKVEDAIFTDAPDGCLAVNKGKEI